MIIQIFKLFGSILVDSDKADKSIAKTGKKAEGLSTKLGKGIRTAAKWGAGLAVGAGAAAAGMVALGVKVGNTADEILDLNSITGMTTGSIQAWRKATEVAGVSTDAVANASAKLTKNLDTMSVEGHKGQEALGKLGLSLGEIENMNADERMDALTEALAGVDDKTERAKIGADLFGGTWKEIAPVVDLGTEAMNKAKDSANIISEEDLKKANDFRIKVADMKEQVGFFVTEIGIGLMPMLTTMATWIQDKMPVIKSTMKTAFDVAGTAIRNVSNFVIENIIPIFTSLFDLIMNNKDKIQVVLSEALNILKTAFDGVKKAVKFVIDNMDILLPIIVGITAAVVAQMIINKLVGFYKMWQAVTKTQTTLQWLLNAALNANPLGIVAIAIGAVIAIGILLYKNWDTIIVKLGEFWAYIKEVFGSIKSFTLGVFSDMASGIKGFVNGIISSINGMIRGLNRIKVSAPAWVEKLTGIGSFGINIPRIPMLEKGGDITQSGRVLVGEAGPEFLDLPKGARVTPLDNNSGDNYNFSPGSIVLDMSKIKDIQDVIDLIKQLNQTSRAGGAY